MRRKKRLAISFIRASKNQGRRRAPVKTFHAVTIYRLKLKTR